MQLSEKFVVFILQIEIRNINYLNTKSMKLKLFTALLFFTFSLSLTINAEEQTRKVDPFSEISLRIGAKLHLEQGPNQNLEIVAKPSTMEEIITEVKNGKLIIRFPNKNYLWSTFAPGDITIYVTTPDIKGLGISGSGDIIAIDEINSNFIDLAVSGSGNIRLSELKAERVKTMISGSGDIVISGKETAQDLSISISGSGNFRGFEFPADDVTIKVAGSGDVDVDVKKNLHVRLAGSGNVNYKGKPLVDQSVAGSGRVRSVK